jgi:hypothetical protein
MRKALSFLCIVWANLAGISFAMSATQVPDWELGNARYQDFAATSDSKLMRETLALPPGDDLQNAEVARLDLAIMRQAEDAKLLKAWMEYDVAASVLGLPAHPAASVGDAIERQRASPALDAACGSARTGVPLARLLLPMAFCILAGANVAMISNSPLILLNDLILSAQRRSVYDAVAAKFPKRSGNGGVELPSKHLYILPDGNMSFGYPANDHDDARTIAHSRLFASSCVDRGSCGRLTYFLQQPSTRHGISLALSIATWLAIATALIAFALKAPSHLVYPAFVGGVPVLIVGAFSFYAVNADSTLIGIIFAVVYGIPIGIGCALAAALLRHIVRRIRGARTPAAGAES